MSINEKASVAMYAKLEEMKDNYNKELAKDTPNANTLASIEEDAKTKCKEITKELVKEKLTDLLQYENPMLELLRQYSMDVPTVKVSTDKETDSTAMTIEFKARPIPASAMTTLLKRYTAKDGFVNTGVHASGAVWLYKSERLAHLLTQRVAKDIEVKAEAQKQIKDGYKLSDKAKEVAIGKDPLSNKSLVSLLQEIMNALCYVDNGKGANLLRCTNKDINFLMNLFTAEDRKSTSNVKVAKGKNTSQYVCKVAHNLITGKAYGVSGFKVEEGTNLEFGTFREPLPVSALRTTTTATDEKAA